MCESRNVQKLIILQHGRKFSREKCHPIVRHLENATSTSDDEFRRDYNKDSSSDASDVACETAKFNVSQGTLQQQF